MRIIKGIKEIEHNKELKEMNKNAKEIANEGCYPCPVCGFSKGTSPIYISSLEDRRYWGDSYIFAVTKIMRRYPLSKQKKIKVYDTLYCDECGAVWEGKPYIEYLNLDKFEF